MPGKMLTVTITGDKTIANKFNAFGKNIGGAVIKPALQDISNAINNTMMELFTPSTGAGTRGQTYKHGHTGDYLSGIQYVLNDKSLEVVDTNPKTGGALMHGTGPSKKVDAKGIPVPSYGVKEWAVDKLELPEDEAWAVARSVAIHGIGWSGGQSPLVPEYPSGQGFFQFPDWIVNDKNRDDFEEIADRIGKLTVSYLT